MVLLTAVDLFFKFPIARRNAKLLLAFVCGKSRYTIYQEIYGSRDALLDNIQ